MIKIENLIYPLAVILGIVLIVTPEYDVHNFHPWDNFHGPFLGGFDVLLYVKY